MALSALRGGVSFLTRIPLETDESDWRRFQETPAVFPVVGYLVGGLAAIPFVLEPLTAAFGYLLVLAAVVGVTHLDGVADLGDAVAVHAAADRRTVLKDTTVGVGAIAAVTIVVVGLALGAVAIGEASTRTAIALVVAAEVGGKLGMATVACVGSAAAEGMGSRFTRNATPTLLVGPIVASIPAAIVLWPSPATLVAVAAGPIVAVAVVGWCERHLGGVNGDVFGAVNELGRVIGLHAGIVVWTLL